MNASQLMDSRRFCLLMDDLAGTWNNEGPRTDKSLGFKPFLILLPDRLAVGQRPLKP